MSKKQGGDLFEAEKPAGKKTETKVKEAAPKPAPAAKLPALASKARPPAAAAPEPTLYQAILHAARDPAVDAAKVKMLVELQIQIEERDAKKAFTRAFNALQFELPEIDKDGYLDHGDGTTAKGNSKLKTRYSTYPNLMFYCRPLLKKHGFTFNNVLEPSADGTKIDVVGYLVHDEGHGMASRFPLEKDPTGRKVGPQQSGSGASYAKRYNLILMLDIVSKLPADGDNDGKPRREVSSQAPDDSPLTMEQAEQLRKAIDDCGVGDEKFREKFGIDAISDLPGSLFKKAMEACRNYAKEVAAARAKRPAADDTFPGDR